MRWQAEHCPQSWLFRGVRQFKARAISSANSFLPIPSSPVNSIAPGSRSETSIRFSTALTREFPVSSSNIVQFHVIPALQKGHDDLFHTLLCVLDWTTRIDQLHTLRFRKRDLQVRIAHTRMKVGVL